MADAAEASARLECGCSLTNDNELPLIPLKPKKQYPKIRKCYGASMKRSKSLSKLIGVIPIATPFPLNSLFPRSIQKMRNIQWIYPRLQFFSLASITRVEDGLCYLKLKHRTDLGLKGREIVVPNDDYMPKRIRFFGHWSRDVSRFLASGVTDESAFLDLGAHCGLVALQTYNLSNVSKIFAVEPMKVNFLSLSKNLELVSSCIDIKLLNRAVTDEPSGIGYLFSEAGATMNSSINPELPGIGSDQSSNLAKEKIRVINSVELCDSFLKWAAGSKVILKSDLQGMDVIVLSDFSDLFWQNVELGTIEICALEYANVEEIELLIKQLVRFPAVYLDPNYVKSISLPQLKDFYLSKSKKTINIFFSK